MKCITEIESLKFIRWLKKKKYNIAYDNLQSKFINVYMYMTDRQLRLKSNMLLKKFRYEKFPIAVPLDIVVDENSEKHSMMLFLETDKCKGYVLEVFDSNGKICYLNGVYLRIMKIVNLLSGQLEDILKARVKAVEVREEYNSINTMNGNCDSLSLLYAYYRLMGDKMSLVNKKLGNKITKMQQKNINNFIRKRDVNYLNLI